VKFSRLFACAAALIPAAASAQMSDAEYCKALSDKYLTYVANMNSAMPHPTPVDAQTAIEQCKAGNAAPAIPVLEQKLRNARIDLPKRS
jgi:hypothetical protein